jgi:mono/diheme cytochrome c family protein
MKRRILFYVAATFAANAALAQPVGGPPAGSAASTASGGSQPAERQAQGNALLQRVCTSCHGIELTTGQPRSRDEWTDVVSRMVGNGAQLNDDEYNILIEYLAIQYGLSSPATRAKANASAGTGGQD